MEQEKNKKFFGLIKRIIICAILLATSIFVIQTAKYYVRNDIENQTNLIINNNNVTKRLKSKLIVENENIYISINDLKNFFDNFIYEDSNQVITSSEKKWHQLVLMKK